MNLTEIAERFQKPVSEIVTMNNYIVGDVYQQQSINKRMVFDNDYIERKAKVITYLYFKRREK